jgi:leucyl aminopeptidase
LKIDIVLGLQERGPSDLLVLPFWEKEIKEAGDFGVLKNKFHPSLKTGDFKAKLGETLLHYVEGDLEPRVLFLGLGPEADGSSEVIRRSFAAAVRVARARKAKVVNFVFPNTRLPKEEALRAFFEGIFLTNYAFTSLKGDSLKKDPMILIERAGFIGLEKSDQKWLQKYRVIAEGIFFARDLVNGNADEVTPARLAIEAEGLTTKVPTLAVKILDRKAIEKEGMGLLLAVSRGSSVEPRFIELQYQGNPGSKEQIVLVGKGVTYDTGGLSLKPTEGMLAMKADMAGAATVLAVVHTAAALHLKVNVTALVPSAENCIDGKSYKLGDVYRSHSGKTVEITNADAEGRLLLADALSYAVQHLNPTCLVDIATLTGGIIIALGDDVSGLFTPDDKLAHELLAASKKTDEPVWRMPLHLDYKEAALKSEIADLINSSTRDASPMKAAFFLAEFTGGISWAHIDFAGPAYVSKPKHYNTTSATGYGVRLLLEFLEARVK